MNEKGEDKASSGKFERERVFNKQRERVPLFSSQNINKTQYEKAHSLSLYFVLMTPSQPPLLSPVSGAGGSSTPPLCGNEIIMHRAWHRMA